MNKLFIVGGDGLARELYMHIIRHEKYEEEFSFGGFLGHAGYGHVVDYKNLQHLYKGELDDYTFEESDFCLIGLGNPALRKKVFDDIKCAGGRLANFISSISVVAEDLVMGEGNLVISSLVAVSVTMGDGNILNGNVAFGHDTFIGDFNFFGPASHLLGNVILGNYNQIGTSSIVLPKGKVGNHNKVAPLSVIYKGCKNNGYYLGNPAVKMGNVDED
jgi:acetyltransferase-like isoleucine patch superfamily enzyme